MHERHLLNDLMARIQSIAAAENATRVVAVQVWLGALSHFTAEHFREHFTDAAQGTVAEHAEVAVTLSTDIHDCKANRIVLQHIEVEQ